MKRLLLAISFLICVCSVNAQQKQIDSVKRLLINPASDTLAVFYRCTLAHLYLYYKPDSSFLLAQEGLTIASKNHFLKGQERCYKEIGEAKEQMGNSPDAMQDYLQCLKIAEKLNIPFDVANALIDIGLIYQDQDEYALAIKYTLRAKNIMQGFPDKNALGYQEAYAAVLVNVGFFYYKSNHLDSALFYEQNAYQMVLKNHIEEYMGNILLNLGLINDKLDNKVLAITYYRMSIKKSEAVNDYTTLANTYVTIANFYKTRKQTDSLAIFSKRALKAANTALYSKGIFEASTILADLYGPNDKELAYGYLKTATIAKDSLYSKEKVKQIQNLRMQEQVREQEIADLKTQHEEERKHNLQVSLIALFIPVFFLLSLLLSKIKIHNRVIEFMSVLSILFLFEFFTLLIYPIVGKFTNHSPAIEFFVFVCVAAVMVPMHHHLTHWLKERLTHLPKWGKHITPEEPEK